MRLGSTAVALGAIVCLQGESAIAQVTVLSMPEVLARVRESAPEVQAARARVAEAEARLAGAGVWLQDNPRLDLVAGPRTGGSTEIDIAVEQQFDARGSRSARIAAAQAALERERAAADAVARVAMRNAAVAFVTLLQREREIAVLEAAQVVTRDVLHAAERRYAVGDIAVLDVNVAWAADARARSDLRSATAGRLVAAGELAAILGLAPSMVDVTGELRDVLASQGGQLRLTLAQRPEFIALAAERREAEAEIRLGEAQRRLRLGASASYEREEGDQIVLGGLTLTFPAFNSGQELRLAGAARARRVDLELEAARRGFEARFEAAAAALAQELSAVEALEQDALPQMEENEGLARRSYEAGQISLADWLVLRRELLETRRAHLEKQRDAAIARIELDAIAGVLR
jgi:cobalt-zinc-cadmium efflux system outer membrane protein